MELQTSIVYGPVQSRRFGRSLRVSLVPANGKVCTFNCVYCQFGSTTPAFRIEWPATTDIVRALERALGEDPSIEAVALAGNGEPTLHPGFARIVDGLLDVRARRAPRVRLAVVSNGSTLHRLSVRHALSLLDERHMKLDAGDATTLLRMNACPISLGRLIADLRYLGGVVLQSMFIRDTDGFVNNTTPAAVSAWLEAVRAIGPDAVHVCALDRIPARRGLVKLDRAELETIAARVAAIGIRAQVFH
jgi:wyosine [tRNA(Phe)-imidazoG37] synthetase (radical SAM superfamily)